MTTLADVLGAHFPIGAQQSGYTPYTCSCKAAFEDVRSWTGHVAEVVAAAGLAVIQLPEPDGDGDFVVRAAERYAAPPYVFPSEGLIVTKYGTEYTVGEARAFGAALLAAAEAVTG